MHGSDSTAASSCGRDFNPGSTAPRCGFLCYVLLVVAIWFAFLWLAFTDSTVAIPAPSTELPHVRAISQPRPIATNTGITSVTDEESHESASIGMSDPVAVEAGLPLMTSTPAADLVSFETAGYSTRRLMIADLQDALIAAGCLGGKPTGHWDDRTREAMSAFLSQANARLPVAQPHDALFHFVKGHSAVMCRRETIQHRPTEPRSIESVSVTRRPPGVMGLGGPTTGLATSTIGIAPKATNTESKRDSGTGGLPKPQAGKSYSGGSPRSAPHGQRSLRDLLLHPLGTS